MSVWWYECEHCHARFMQASSLDEHVCAQKRIAELEECIAALESALAEAQRERDEAREELDRLRRALDLALKFDWTRGTGKAREGTDG